MKRKADRGEWGTSNLSRIRGRMDPPSSSGEEQGRGGGYKGVNIGSILPKFQRKKDGFLKCVMLTMIGDVRFGFSCNARQRAFTNF